ncbi:MAG: carboxypeptidase-like regulatory domain-containing protein, partial [Candidatus Hatepunaea meridiana]|nr:carboxypeptidase-like regulatory domain-containing protein [Candidatus Hatepunaea meridiana]
MTYSQRILLIGTLMIGFFCYGSIIAEVSVEPFGFAVSVEEDAEAEVELVLSNGGEDNIAFCIDYELIEDEDDNRAGPRRDDLGDHIGGFDSPGGNWFGITWDGELIWALSYAENRMIGIDMDGEIAEDLNANIQSCTGLAWDGEAFWMGSSGHELVRIDREGDRIAGFRVQGQLPRGVAWDGENLWYSNLSGELMIQQVTTEGEVLRTLDLGEINHSRLSVTWVPEHRDGHLWTHHTGGELLQLNVEEDRPEVIQRVMLHNGGNNWGIDHDGENLWYTAPGRFNRVDDGIQEFHMLTFEPEEGVIAGDDSELVNILVQSEDVEAGVYNILVTIELSEPEEDRDDLEQALIEISAIVTVGDATSNLSGVVTDASTDEVIEDVTIEMDSFIMTRFSNDEGIYGFENLPPGEYEFTFTAPDYLPTTEDVEIDEDDVELNVELLHSECTPSEDEFFMELNPDMEHVFRWEVTNGGNGPLVYSVERQLLGDANTDP